MIEKYIKIKNLSIAESLLNFVNKKLLPGTKIKKEKFWYGFDKSVHELSVKNKELLEIRERLQKKIDDWHKTRKGEKINIKKYTEFLKKIGYLKKHGPNFKISTRNVDKEISNICGPQLVCPISNARFILNAANARWISLYDSLYGTDVIPETQGALKGKTYNPIRGKKVIEYSRNLLDKYVPLKKGSWKDISKIPQVNNNKLSLKLKNPKQFVGYKKKSNNLSSLLLINNNLHIDIIFDQDGTLEINNPEGNQDKAAIHDIFLESAISTICDHEDSVAAVDAEDKVLGYRNWLGLMKGDLNAEFKKKGKKYLRKLNLDRNYISPKGKKFKLHGRALLLNRNVGHLMTNPAILLKDGSECPEGILDAFITCAACLHDFKRKGNSKLNSIYIVKPKMHGPEEVKFTCDLFTAVEQALKLKPLSVKIGIMDEERRTTINLKECIEAAKDRVIFINTGFLDRTGDEIHTSMEAGPMIPKALMKQQPWITAYEDWNVDKGLETGFQGKAQIGKGMWPMPDEMLEMYKTKTVHPKAGANCAWVPSPTAATLHALHYHQVSVSEAQDQLKERAEADIDSILTIPLLEDPSSLSDKEIQDELDNNAQGILGYVVRWIDQGVGCSKVPDINNVGLMEDRATCRISSQHMANWLHHGLCTEDQVMETMKKMALVVDKQNDGDPDYINMAPSYEGIAFKAACDLVLQGRSQPSGYTEPILHKRRLEFKS